MCFRHSRNERAHTDVTFAPGPMQMLSLHTGWKCTCGCCWGEFSRKSWYEMRLLCCHRPFEKFLRRLLNYALVIYWTRWYITLYLWAVRRCFLFDSNGLISHASVCQQEFHPCVIMNAFVNEQSQLLYTLWAELMAVRKIRALFQMSWNVNTASKIHSKLTKEKNKVS